MNDLVRSPDTFSLRGASAATRVPAAAGCFLDGGIHICQSSWVE